MDGRVGKLRLLFLVLSILCGLGVLARTAETARPAAGEPRVTEVALPPNDFPNAHSPFWLSADELGFVVDEDRNSANRGGVFAYNFRTQTVRQLLEHPVSFPTIVKAGERLSYVAIGKDGTLSLFTTAIKGGLPDEYEFGGIGVFSPSWSPDGREVVFANLSYDAELVIGNPQTHTVLSLGNLGRGRQTNGVEAPDWSPEGNGIVYVGWDVASRTKTDDYIPTLSRLYLYELSSKRYRRLTKGSAQDRYPVFSPRGHEIAFVSNRTKNWELWVVNYDGTHLRRLTAMSVLGWRVIPDRPAWSPDGTRAAFTAARVGAVRRERNPFSGARLWVLQVP